QLVKDFNKKIEINGVMTIANDVPFTVASIAEELNLKGISLETARIASDKLLMKKILKENNINIPEFKEIFSGEEIKKLIEEWGEPIIVKPNDGRGARGVIRVTKNIDFNWAFLEAKKNSYSGRVIAESFLEGVQLSTESMIYEGKSYTAAISQRNYDLVEKYAPYMIENGGIIPADLDQNTTDSIEELITAVAKAMKINNNTIKGDLVITANGPYVIEFAARLSGGYLCTDQIPTSRGVDLVKETINLSLGKKLDIAELIPKDLCKIGIRYFFPKPGVVKSINGFSTLNRYKWILKKELNIKVGDIISNVVNHPSRVGFVHAKGKTFNEAQSRAIRAINEIKIEVADE
ncbi:MAG: ATP-grasp domain-containing protein, partial [Pseudomonadota bacterium]|nr:ATP-grasp domain-containing protein [Pseudomonadota bacterium]